MKLEVTEGVVITVPFDRPLPYLSILITYLLTLNESRHPEHAQ